MQALLRKAVQFASEPGFLSLVPGLLSLCVYEIPKPLWDT